MKIRKLCTYENIQLENIDGKRPSGTWSRLQKTFLDAHFDMDLIPGIGVKLISKDDGDRANCFIIPFANIPFLVTTEGSEHETTEAKPVAIQRRRRPTAVQVPTADAQESEDCFAE